jgi:hypothetical protein
MAAFLRKILITYLMAACSILPLIINQWATRSAALLVASLVARPAFAIDPDGADGQKFGEALLTQPNNVQYNSGTNTYTPVGANTATVDSSTGQFTSDGTTTGNGMFPAGGDSPLSATVTTGPSDANPNPAPPPSATDLDNIKNGGTDRGDAYSTILNGHIQRKQLPPLTTLLNDPALQQSKDVMAGTHPESSTLFDQGCTTTDTTSTTTGETRIHDYRTCQVSTPKTPECSAQRILSAFGYFKKVMSVQNFGVDTHTDISFRVIEPTDMTATMGPIPYPMTPTIKSNWAALGGKYDAIENGDVAGKSLGVASITLDPVNSANIPNWGASYIAAEVTMQSTSGSAINGYQVLTQPSAANGWVVTIRLDDDDANDAHGAYFDAYVSVKSVTQTINDIPAGCAHQISTNDFSASNFPAFTQDASDASQASTFAWKCSDAFTSRTLNSVVINASEFGTILGPLYKDGVPSPICMSADLRTPLNMTASNACFVDIHGSTICHTGDALQQTNTCGTLQSDPACSFIEAKCIVSNQDGSCQIKQNTYDCGVTQTVVTGQTNSSSISCNTPIKCMGNECVTSSNEQNNGFGKAASALSAIQMGALDSKCDPNTGCILFEGTFSTCKTAFGGVQDCCTQPTNVSGAEYLVGALDAYALAENLGVINQLSYANVVPGSWVDAAAGAQKSMTDLSKSIFTPEESIASSFESVGGVVADTSAAISNVVSTSVSAVEQFAVNVFHDITASFSPALEGILFDAGATAGDYVMSDAAKQIGTEIGNFLSGVGTAIAAVQLAILAIQLAYQCEDTEMKLGADRQMKLCAYVGSYCSQGATICTEMRESYCCYKTQLARILQEQLRRDPSRQPDFNQDFGPPDSPNCSGLTPNDLGLINWDNVVLDEWIAIMTQSGLLSDGSQADMDERFKQENITQKHGATYAQTKLSGVATKRAGDTADVINSMDPAKNIDKTRSKSADQLMNMFP